MFETMRASRRSNSVFFRFAADVPPADQGLVIGVISPGTDVRRSASETPASALPSARIPAGCCESMLLSAVQRDSEPFCFVLAPHLTVFRPDYNFFVFNARKEFNTAMTVTPTSANTASHMVATPNALSTSTMAFIDKASQMFCFAILNVF